MKRNYFNQCSFKKDPAAEADTADKADKANKADKSDSPQKRIFNQCSFYGVESSSDSGSDSATVDFVQSPNPILARPLAVAPGPGRSATPGVTGRRPLPVPNVPVGFMPSCPPYPWPRTPSCPPPGTPSSPAGVMPRPPAGVTPRPPAALDCTSKAIAASPPAVWASAASPPEEVAGEPLEELLDATEVEHHDEWSIVTSGDGHSDARPR